MKKVLLVLGILSIGGGIVGFFSGLSVSPFSSVFSALIGILGSIPFFALIGAMEDIERLKEQVETLQGKLNRLLSLQAPSPDSAEPAAFVPPMETARQVWECVKCGTVNKAGTAACSHCGAQYSSWVNPTDKN